MTLEHSTQYAVAMTFWTFDILHPWHDHYIREALKYGQKLFIVVARDSRVLERKWTYPHNHEDIRVANLQKTYANGTNVEIVLGDTNDIFRIIDTKKPNILVFWYDQYVPEETIREKFPSMETVRIGSYRPDIYKSSLLRKNLN